MTPTLTTWCHPEGPLSLFFSQWFILRHNCDCRLSACEFFVGVCMPTSRAKQFSCTLRRHGRTSFAKEAWVCCQTLVLILQNDSIFRENIHSGFILRRKIVFFSSFRSEVPFSVISVLEFWGSREQATNWREQFLGWRYVQTNPVKNSALQVSFQLMSGIRKNFPSRIIRTLSSYRTRKDARTISCRANPKLKQENTAVHFTLLSNWIKESSNYMQLKLFGSCCLNMLTIHILRSALPAGLPGAFEGKLQYAGLIEISIKYSSDNLTIIWFVYSVHHWLQMTEDRLANSRIPERQITPMFCESVHLLKQWSGQTVVESCLNMPVCHSEQIY